MKTDDADIPQIAAAYQLKGIVRYINIGEQYFDYVTDNENVYFYKVYEGEILIGTVHLEKQQGILFISMIRHQKNTLNLVLLRTILIK